VPDYRRTLVDYSGNYYLQFIAEIGLPGLILILFIFFLIFKKVVQYLFFKKNRAGFVNFDWLIISLFISFISMAIALVFGPHTNFNEIQFTFWLVIALLLSSIKIRKDREINVDIHDMGSMKFDYIDRIAFSVMILIFLTSTVMASFSNLSINIKQNLYGYMNRYGYYDYTEEPYKDRGPYRWLTTISSDIVEKEGDVLYFWINAGHPDVKRDDLYVRFYIDNSLKRIVRLEDREWHYMEFNISNIDRDKVTLTICLSNTLIPRDCNVEKESRDPGIMITNREFKNE
jgi:hypothetical protein